MSAVLDTQTVPEITANTLIVDSSRIKKTKDISNYTQPSLNAQKVIESRYSMKDTDGKPTENWFQICDRVIDFVGRVESSPVNREAFGIALRDIMYSRKFLPNTPALINAGKNDHCLAACHVSEIGDSIESIMEQAKLTALVSKSGGGMGVSYEHIRPKNSIVSTTGGQASGPVSFMKILNTVADVVAQGGARRAALMGILSINHADLLIFIHAKNDQTSLTNFNISLTITDEFMTCVKEKKWFQCSFEGQPWTKPVFDPLSNGDYCLYSLDSNNPNDAVSFANKAEFDKWKAENPAHVMIQPPTPGMVFAPEVWRRILKSALVHAEPGVIFIDEVNRYHPLINTRGKVESCNPCVSGDNYVFTSKGIIKVQELYDQQQKVDMVIDSRMSLKPGNTRASVPFFKTGTKDVFLLETKEGYRLKATSDHRIMTTKGYVELGKLVPNDQIYILDQKGCFGDFGDLVTGRVLGWLMGDGHVSCNRAVLSFYDKKQVLFDEFLVYANEVVANVAVKQFAGKDTGNIVQRTGTQYGVTGYKDTEHRYTISSERLYNHLQNIGLQDDNLVTLLPKILTGTQDCIIGFLQGLFSANGTVSGNKQTGMSVRLSDVNMNLLRAVQLMLLNLGIQSSIYQSRQKEGFKLMPDGKGSKKKYFCQSSHELLVSGDSYARFFEHIAFLTDYQNQKYVTQKHKTKPFLARVKSISYHGHEDVYDTTVQDAHSFNCEGQTISNCGEEFLNPYDTCNLGALDLAKYYTDATYRTAYSDQDLTPLRHFEFETFASDIYWAVRFLDNVIDAGSWPDPKIDKTVKSGRPIGLGTMGLADLLIKLKVNYNSEQGRKIAGYLLSFLRKKAWSASLSLATEKGIFPEFEANKDAYLRIFSGKPEICAELLERLGNGLDYNKYPDEGLRYLSQHLKLRNWEVTTSQPTGTVSLVAETSSGIEPNFSFAHIRKDTVSTRYYAHPLVLEYLKKEIPQTLCLTPEKELQYGCEFIVSSKHLLPDYFVTAGDMSSKEHILMLAELQRHVDNSISKTTNGKATDTLEDVEECYMLAYESGCKAISYYRDGSREGQVLTAITATPEPTPSNNNSGEPTIDNNVGAGSSSCLGMDMGHGDRIAKIVERSGSSSSLIDVSRVADFNRQVEEAKKSFDTFNSHISDHNQFLKQAMLNKQEYKATLAVRPAILEGKTYRVPFNGDSIYVTVNTDQTGSVVEVLVDESTGHYKTIGKLISKMLRSNPMMIDEILHTLLHAKGDGSTSFNQKMCTSIEQIVAECIKMRRHETIKAELRQQNFDMQATIEAIKIRSTANNEDLSNVKDAYCPECHAVMLDGAKCKVCGECGYSKCG